MELKSLVAATLIATSNLVAPVDVTDDDISGGDTVIEENAPESGTMAGDGNMRDGFDNYDVLLAILDENVLQDDEEEEKEEDKKEGGDGKKDNETGPVQTASDEKCEYNNEVDIDTINNHVIMGGSIDDVEVEVIETQKAWISKSVNCRDIPDKTGTLIKTYKTGQQINIIGKVTKNPYNDAQYYQTDVGFIHAGYISFTEPVKEEVIVQKTEEQSVQQSEPQSAPQANAVNVQLPVSNIFQNPELPNGCEITSLTICLNYKGYAVDKCVMSDNYLPKWPDLSGDPEYYYLREPRSNGFYCFAGCLCTTIDNYNAANGTSIQYKNLTGSGVSSLYAEIDAGNPVVVWGTLKWGNPRAYESGLYRNLHCMVLAGYTDTTVTIIDPIYGDKLKTIKRSTFESVWGKMGSRAMVVTQ